MCIHVHRKNVIRPSITLSSPFVIPKLITNGSYARERERVRGMMYHVSTIIIVIESNEKYDHSFPTSF